MQEYFFIMCTYVFTIILAIFWFNVHIHANIIH